MELRYPERIPLALSPTPFHALERVSQQFGCGHRIWVKRDDQTGSVLSGNKVRKLEFVAARALGDGCDTLITCGGVQSNHCRATALVGAQLGLQVHLVLRGEEEQPADGNLLLDHLAGARVSHYRRGEFIARLDELLEGWRLHYQERGASPMVIPTGASDGLGIWGYLAASEEIAADLRTHDIEHAHLVCATGSGGTQAGLTLGATLHEAPYTPWGINVCEDEAWFLNKVNADMQDWAERNHRSLPRDIRVRVIDGYVGPGYGRAEAEVFETIATVARLEGLVLDPVYTGKAFHGMLSEIQSGRFEGCRDIVFLHTGGVYGVFPMRGEFNFLA